jgi:hypothetical protein
MYASSTPVFENRLNPCCVGSQPRARRKTVRTPSGPRVAMNAKASGMPPKFAATPENVVRAERIQRGVPSRIAAYAIARPTTPPISAVTRLTSMLVLYASM